MKTTTKQLKHYQEILRNGLSKFQAAVRQQDKDDRYEIIITDWQNLIDSPEQIRSYADNIKNVASLFGFGREFSSKSRYEELVNRVAERFAEFDLAKHAIRELAIEHRGEKLEKLTEEGEKVCDFRILNPSYYFEAKYTKNITISSLERYAKDALCQIEETMRRNRVIGCRVVWIFTYASPNSPSNFQDQIMCIKEKCSLSDSNFRLNVQTYKMGLYGDATVL